jgi:hypothetical protein
MWHREQHHLENLIKAFNSKQAQGIPRGKKIEEGESAKRGSL